MLKIKKRVLRFLGLEKQQQINEAITDYATTIAKSFTALALRIEKLERQLIDIQKRIEQREWLQ